MPDRPILTLAHSPDADDMAMGWPLTGMLGPDGARAPGVDGAPAIETGRVQFSPVAADVEDLNRRAIHAAEDGAALGPGALDITAISAAAYPAVAHAYAITAAGASFGEGYGPKVVTRPDSTVRCEGCLRGQKPSVAIPGRRTTAFMVLSILLEGARDGIDFIEMPFAAIPGAVARCEAGCGLLIHEAQLMIERENLREVVDLGAWWQRQTQQPLPLGLNVLRRDLDARFGAGAAQEVAATLARSVQYARAHPEATRRFLMMRAIDRPEWTDAGLLSRYLDMYMSAMTADMGAAGAAALGELYRRADAAGLIPAIPTLDIQGTATD
ncbi:MAG: MqnA/MqnD/SBP family protein [Phycisphaerales bacterium JB039]